MTDFLQRLRERKLGQWALAYAAGAWVVLQGLDLIGHQFDWPSGVLRGITVALGVGFFATLVLAWYHGERGAQKISGIELSILTVLLAIGGLLLWRFAPTVHEAPAVASSAQPAVASSAIPAKSIAVLPFVNMSADPAQEYFSDGIAEELLNRLAQFSDLKVAARTSAFQFKGKNLDIGDIGRRLKVTHVLEGSVRKAGARLRITAQLIDSNSGYHLWSETYDRDASDVFKVQDEIAGAIADALEAKLGGPPTASTPARTANPAAYDDYLQGRAFVAKRRIENLDKAIAAFDRAIAQDPGYSAAHSGRAYAALLRPLWGATDIAASLMKARSSAEKALKLDPGNAEAYMVRGLVASFSNDYTAAGANFDHALSLAPGNVDVLNMAGDFRLIAGDMAGGEHAKRQAMALDPLAFVHPMNLSDALSAQGRYPEAIVAVEQAIALGAGEFGYDRLVFYNARLKRFDAAQATVEKGCALDPTSVAHCDLNRVQLLASQGQRPQAELKLDAIASGIRKEELSPGGLNASAMTLMYLEVGDIAKATQWQRTAVDVGDWFPTSALLNQPGGAKLPEEVSRDPGWLAVWSDPRLKDVMTNYRRNLLAWRACSRTGTTCP